MKLLFIDAHHQYLNPTSGLLPAMICAAAPDVRFYGPGYSSDEDLKCGVLDFMERTGPYDGVVFGMQVPLFAWDEDLLLRNARHVRLYNALASPPEALIPFFRDILANVAKLPVRCRFVSLLNFDYYNAPQRCMDVLEELDAYVIGPGMQFAPEFSDLPDWAWKERHFAADRGEVSNGWTEFLGRRPDHVLSLPHFVADAEFSFRGLAERRERISIPGVEYFMRKEGRKALKARGLRPSGKPIFNALRAANRLGLRLFTRFLFLKIYHASYFGALIDTRFVYTARDGSGMPVRKFFEIPAAGAVMLCVPPIAFHEFGFRDGEHYLQVTPESLPDMIEVLERDPDRAQAIANAGRALVFKRHRLSARAGQLAQCLDAIADGSFAGSRWNGGEFEVLRRGSGAPAGGDVATLAASGAGGR